MKRSLVVACVLSWLGSFALAETPPLVIKSVEEVVATTTKPFPDAPGTLKFKFFLANRLPGIKPVILGHETPSGVPNITDCQAFFLISGNEYPLTDLNLAPGDQGMSRNAQGREYLWVDGDSDGCSFIELGLYGGPINFTRGYLRETGTEVTNYYVPFTCTYKKVALKPFLDGTWNKFK